MWHHFDDDNFTGWVRHCDRDVALLELDATSQPWCSFASVHVVVVDAPAEGDPSSAQLAPLASDYAYVHRKTCFATLLNRFAEEHGLDPANYTASCDGQRIYGYVSLAAFDKTSLNLVLTPRGGHKEVPTAGAQSTWITLRVFSTSQ